jgi:hypothetical protein
MKYRLLGNSGLRVSEMALGAMTFGEDWGWGSAKDEAQKWSQRDVRGPIRESARTQVRRHGRQDHCLRNRDQELAL